MNKRIFFSVGEPSGDEHAARLIRAIRARDGEVRVRGFGGPEMRSAGCRLDRDLTGDAVVGLLEVLPKLRRFFRYADEAEQVFARGEVDAVVLVDFPGFNWHIAKRARQFGIPVYYYCPPQLWAWGRWRLRKLRRNVDEVLAVLPMEEQFFREAGVPTCYVGHPFFDAVEEKPLEGRCLRRLEGEVAAGVRHVAVLPGSRDHEVERNWPLMLQAIRELASRHPDTKFLVASYRDRHCMGCRRQLTDADRTLPIEFFVDRTSEVIRASRCAMMVSGSVSLELMARGTPAAVIYRVGRILHRFARMVLQVRSITLPNLMAGRNLFPEFVSVGNPRPAVDFLVTSIDAMLSDPYYYDGLVRELQQLRMRYALPGASERAAKRILDHLKVSGYLGTTRAVPEVATAVPRVASKSAA